MYINRVGEYDTNRKKHESETADGSPSKYIQMKNIGNSFENSKLFMTTYHQMLC